MQLADEKLISKSRFAPATRTSREYAEKIIRELTAEGLIKPQRTPTGRDYLSFKEAQVVWNRLLGQQ